MDAGGFDAAFVAVGAHLSKRVDIPNGDASRVLDAVSFLRDVEAGTADADLGRVAVYGGGNTAMDAARVARRLGADDTVIVYRRTRDQMPAHEDEAADAEEEGIRINWLRTIASMGEHDLTVEIQELDESGRPHGTGRYETLAADTVILALGQESDTRFLATVPGVAFEADVVQVDPVTLMTGAPGIFAGGDAVPSERTVTIGVGHGKKAARSIDHEQRQQVELDPAQRVKAFDEVVAGLTPAEAVFEAGRCLSCGNCFECDGCLGSCPEDAVIKLGPGHRYRFDYDRCTGCSSCARQCPVHAIEMIGESEPLPDNVFLPGGPLTKRAER
jgi:NADPH-dependent glutamate synthase beta subunit-like oxidoreductase